MATETAPADYVQVGETVFVVFPASRLGTWTADGWTRAKVAKINKTTFTVEGVKLGDRLVQFSNRHGANGRHEATGSNGAYVIQDGTELSEQIILRRKRFNVVKRVDDAAHHWSYKIARERGSPYPDRRPTPEQVDAALVELIEAAAQARKALGIPGDDGTTVEA